MTIETSPILDDSEGDGNQTYYDAAFRNTLECLFPSILNSSAGYRTMIIERSDMHQASGDFYRICAKKSGLSRAYWWIMLRLNGHSHPAEYVGDKLVDTILVPDPSYFDELLQKHLTANPVNN